MIGRLLCRLFGHPEHEEFSISFCDGEPLLVGCGRCGAELVNNLKETG